MIPFLDLQTQYRSIKEEIDAAVLEVLEKCQFALGPAVQAFEEAFASYCQVKYGIGVNSGTSALHLAMLAGGIGPGDEVITTPFTFVATVAAIRYTGAKPVFVDIAPDSFTIDPSLIQAAITPRTKAIVPVHLYGQPADMDPVLEVAKRHNLLVIEDAAQAHGAEYKGRRAGSMGDLGCFSFYPGKNLGAGGEGGMVVTNNADFTRRIRMHRDWGAERKYEHVIEGFNYRMEGIQGAILGVKLRYLPKWTEARRRNAAAYHAVLKGGPVQTPREMPYAKHVYHVYAVRAEDRAGLQAMLGDRKIGTNIHYPYPVHLLPAHTDLGHRKGEFPHAEKAALQTLSLPMFPELTEQQIKTVGAAIHEYTPRK